MTPEKGGSLPGGLLFVCYLQRTDLDPKGDFMKNKQIRRIIILIMCLVFFFNLAVSAYAISAGAAAFTAIAAGVAVAGTLQALGITAGSETSTFDQVVSDAVSYLESAGTFVSNGLITMAGLQNPETLRYTSYAQADMVQTLLEWAFDTSVVQKGVSLPSDDPDLSNAYSKLEYVQKTYSYYWIGISNGVLLIGANNVGFEAQTGSGYLGYRIVSKSTGSSYWSWRSGNPNSGYSTYLRVDSYHFYTTGVNDKYSSVLDLLFGNIESPFIDGAPVGFGSLAVYMPWASRGISIPLPGTTTDEDWVPVTIGGISVDTDVLVGSQADAQAGTVADGVTWVESEAVPDVTPGTATLSDILSAILSIPQAIVGSISQALSNFFGLSGTADAYAISLTDFFPFCIPFDIYDFLSVLSAAPEAPVFHWEIPVPQLGRTFDIDVDLSPWDPVASVFRTFELLAFIVGLGMITREKFLRS